MLIAFARASGFNRMLPIHGSKSRLDNVQSSAIFSKLSQGSKRLPQSSASPFIS